MRRVKLRSAARADIKQIAFDIGKVSVRSARRFFYAVEKVASRLIKFPELGGKYESDDADHQGLRVIPIKGFKKYLLFYRVRDDEIEVVRVIHGARDIPAVLEKVIMTTPTESYSPGLEGVIAGETAISTVTGGLRYRGYPVVELAEKSTFDEVAYLLLHGELPNRSQLADFNKRLASAQKLPALLSELLTKLPKNAVPMDVLRTGVSILANYDPELEDNSKPANLRKAERLLAQIPLVIAEYYRATKGQPAAASKPELGFAANMMYMLTGKPPSAPDAKAFDVSLILYAEHEFNASTFTARVVVSTESDMHSAITAAIGALKGRLHGGANEKVMDMLLATGGPDKAEAWIRSAIARKEKVMGFGHRVYKHGDVRARVLKEYSRQAAERAGTTQWEAAAESIEKVLETEKNLFPNLDWPAGRLYHSLGLDVPLYTPFFVASRITGWAAHVIEQLEHNRIMRPRGLYTGPEEKQVTPIAERG